MITSGEIAAALGDLGVRPGGTVFLHSGLAGAARVAGSSAAEKLATVIDGCLTAVGSGTLIVPTFTYSFTRDEEFETEVTHSAVGALGEHFRTMPGVRRTADPIFSCAVHGPLPPEWERALLEPGDTDCFGPRSVFAYLLEADATLVFFGVGFDYCTFVYHVEQRLGVPYRYFKDFSGTIRQGGRSIEAKASYYVRELTPETECCFGPLWSALLAAGAGREASLPRGPKILAVPASAIEPEAARQLAANPDFLIRRGHQAPAPPAGSATL